MLLLFICDILRSSLSWYMLLMPKDFAQQDETQSMA